MIYKGKKLSTYTEIIDVALSLKGKEQREFVGEYAKTGPHALQNIGYVSGYYPADKANKIMEVFQTAHPIFGSRRSYD